MTIRAETPEQARRVAKVAYREPYIRTVFVVRDANGADTGLRDYTFKAVL